LVTAAAGCAALVAFAALGTVGRDAGPAMAGYLGLAHLVLLAGWPALVLGVLVHRWWLWLPAGLASALDLRAWWTATPPGPVGGGADALRVVTANLFYRNASGAASWAIIAAATPDVVLLQEVSSVSASWLPPAGWHAQVVSRDDDAFGVAVLTRRAPMACEVIELGGLPQLRVTLRHSGRDIAVWSVHPKAPVTVSADRLWRRQLAELGDRLAAEGADVVIVGGDVNASPAHPPFAALLTLAGLTDARGPRRRLGATWPSSWKSWPPIPPRSMALDHVLVRGASVVSVRVLPAAASDHHPLLVELGLG